MTYVRKFFYNRNGKTYGPYYRLVKTKRIGHKVIQEIVKYIPKKVI